MMGRTHIISGQVAWMAIAPIYVDETWKLIAGIAVAGFAALGPDIDSGGSTICRLLFWFPDGVNRVLHWLFRVRRRRVGDRIAGLLGGHRFGAHSVASCFAVFWLFALTVPFVDGWWFTMAITLGWVMHIVGDCATESGVGIGWPWTKRKFRYASIDVDGPVEGMLIFPLLNVVGVLLALNLIGFPVLDTAARILQPVTQ